MSLTSQLHNGPLGAWCADNLTGTTPLVQQIQGATMTRTPVRPGGRVSDDHWATIGAAFSQRLAYLIDPTPPRAATLGAQRAGVSDQLVTTLLDLTARHLQQHAPVGHLANTREAEDVLARSCWVLAGWEEAYRGGQLPLALARHHAELPPYMGADAAVAAAELLCLEAPAHVIGELVTLAGRLHGSGALAEIRQLLVRSDGLAAPVFVEHWADGDLLIGDTLIDAKTVMHTRDPHRVATWLWQLLGYAWLDTHDRYRIRRVGLYLARHGILLSWPLDMLAETLVRVPECVAPARAEFLDLAYQAMDFEGAVPLSAPAPTQRSA